MCLRGTLFYHLMESTPLNHWHTSGPAVETWTVIHVQANGFQLHQPILNFNFYMAIANWQYWYFRDRDSMEWSSRYWNTWTSKEIYIYILYICIYIFETQTVETDHILLKTGKKCGLYAKFELACESVIINRFVFKSYLSFDLSLNEVT